jgi:2-dehydro-3-deoxygluconokinase
LPSFEDEATYFGDKSIEATAERYRNAGAKSVIVKNGGGAIYFTHDGGAGLVTPPKGKRIVDTTAAGDSFNAGIFAGLDRAKSMEDLIEFASQISGQVIEQKGALVPLNFGIAESKEGTRLTAEGR